MREVQLAYVVRLVQVRIAVFRLGSVSLALLSLAQEILFAGDSGQPIVGGRRAAVWSRLDGQVRIW